ncbi:hypothetical protein ACFSCX_13720 [Bacillus salitolerans]|uniref:IS110 family transposase n=1 Tax=Bacillus salitolerans TaxID=1437434 RepID=A0ABW4LS64_9BACI
MEVIIERACGMDVHKDSITACILTPKGLLTRKEMYVDLGEDYFDKQREQYIVRHSLRRLESLGYTVSLSETKVS